MPTERMSNPPRPIVSRLRFSSTAIACALFAILPTASRAALPPELRVVTYNIHHGEGTDNKFDLSRIAKVVMAEKPHIVALQEVDQKTKRASGVDQPAEFAKLMNMQVYFGHNIDYDGGGYGTAVLTKLPVRSAESVKLKSFYESTPQHAEQRGVQVLELGDKNDPPLWFLCTHLDYRPKDDERMDSAHTINDLVEKHGNEPAIIAGDFNATPDSAPVQEFAKSWKIAGEDSADAAQPKILTFPADKPNRRIDYVMCRPAKDWQVVETRVIDEPMASDHRPVLTVLRKAS
jgi:endonuclease/exonuclease/phosphatase family metal-dependent hydrolase